MANRWVKLIFDGVNARSSEFPLSDGNKLTGRFYYDLNSLAAGIGFAVEVWSRTVLALQSKTVPAVPGVEETALVYQYYAEPLVPFGELWDSGRGSGDNSSGMLLVGCQPSASLGAETIWIEVQD